MISSEFSLFKNIVSNLGQLQFPRIVKTLFASVFFNEGNDLNKFVQVAWRYLHTAASAYFHERANHIEAERAENENEIKK